jgi:hypothetical protein
MNALKAAATARLRRTALIAPDQRVWARHGSVQTLTRAEAIARTARYTAEEQGRGGYLIGGA